MVHEVRSQQYERNAEPLPHVQHHTVFKGFLAGFYRQLYTILHNKIRVQPLLLLLWLQIY